MATNLDVEQQKQARLVKFEGEQLRRKNVRGGPGWWMDLDGVWRAPEEWPEDYPPLPGWTRDRNGRWAAPHQRASESNRWTRLAEDAHDDEREPEIEVESPSALADKRAMLSVTGILAAIALLIAGAMVLITQAGAEPEDVAPPSSDVIFAAETEQALAEQRQVAAAEQPAKARNDLAALAIQRPVPADAAPFDPAAFAPAEVDCLSLAERVLIARSQVPVTYVDQLECVVDTGQWVDRAHGNTIRRVVDAEVVAFVPFRVAYESGAWAWSADTKAAFASDLAHPATRQVVTAGFGHNPRAQDPSAWRPASQSQWCAYAVDWIAVKSRWELSVTPAERSALASMLDTCADSTSAGADPNTVVLTELDPPTISPPRQ